MSELSTVTVDSFRAAFPAFADPMAYLGPEIQFWIDLGSKLINQGRWGDLAAYGLQLFVAHNLALEAARCSGGGSGAPGAIVGALSSASVDKVSYSRDASAAMETGAGHWNLTTYGMRYIRLVRMIGAGPIQVGVPVGATNGNSPAGWPGPFPYPLVGS